jgi:hypothetical protein
METIPTTTPIVTPSTQKQDAFNGFCNIRSKKFFTAGHAIFTVEDGNRHNTFMISRDNDSQPFFVSLLTGPNNEENYTYIGVYNPFHNMVYTTKKSKFFLNSYIVKLVNFAVKAVGQPIPTGFSIRHSDRCCRCNKTLTTPESLEQGIGPICINLVGW